MIAWASQLDIHARLAPDSPMERRVFSDRVFLRCGGRLISSAWARSGAADAAVLHGLGWQGHSGMTIGLGETLATQCVPVRRTVTVMRTVNDENSACRLVVKLATVGHDLNSAR